MTVSEWMCSAKAKCLTWPPREQIANHYIHNTYIAADCCVCDVLLFPIRIYCCHISYQADRWSWDDNIVWFVCAGAGINWCLMHILTSTQNAVLHQTRYRFDFTRAPHKHTNTVCDCPYYNDRAVFTPFLEFLFWTFSKGVNVNKFPIFSSKRHYYCSGLCQIDMILSSTHGICVRFQSSWPNEKHIPRFLFKKRIPNILRPAMQCHIGCLAICPQYLVICET